MAVRCKKHMGFQHVFRVHHGILYPIFWTSQRVSYTGKKATYRTCCWPSFVSCPIQFIHAKFLLACAPEKRQVNKRNKQVSSSQWFWFFSAQDFKWRNKAPLKSFASAFLVQPTIRCCPETKFVEQRQREENAKTSWWIIGPVVIDASDASPQRR